MERRMRELEEVLAMMQSVRATLALAQCSLNTATLYSCGVLN